MGRPAGRSTWGEAGIALIGIALLSPLVVFASAGWMPIWGLFSVAGGIAVLLALAGRRLHDALLADVLRGRSGTLRWILTIAVVLIGVFVVLVGVAVALVWIASGQIRTTPL